MPLEGHHYYLSFNPPFMEDDPETKRWNTITGISLVVAVAISIAIGFLTEPLNGVFSVLILSGLFLSVEFYLRDESRKSGGPSTADGVIVAGILLAGIGACGFVYSYTDNVMITSVCVIAAMMVAAAVMIIRNRRFL